MTFAKGRTAVLCFVAVLPIPTGALAQAKVDVQADTVLVSNNGSTIDPPELAKLKERFLKNGLAFTSFKRLASAKLSLEQGKVAKLELPNKKVVTVKLESLKEGTARVQVEVPPLSQTIALGREGSLPIFAGDHEGGKLVFVLVPSTGGKPRRTAGARPSGSVCPRSGVVHL